MTYEIETLAARLKSERESKGLSQRDLSALTGVPQSHISKIETSGVDLRISSLAALAHALGLDLALVPRKAMPAIQSIARTVDVTPRVSPDVAKEFTRLAREIENVSKLQIDPQTFQEVQDAFKNVAQFKNLVVDPSLIKSARDAIAMVQNSGMVDALHQATRDLKTLRNTLAHTPIHRPPKPRRAYQLDDDDG